MKIIDLFKEIFGASKIKMPGVIGKQVWMTKNLDVAYFRNGDTIPEVKTSEEWKVYREKRQPAWCYFNNDPKNGERYGKLYNWHAINDPRGLAPEGWHIPTIDEWNKLIKFLGRKEAGLKLKSEAFWELKGNGSNESGFSGLPGGYRQCFGGFDSLLLDGNWWSSTVNTDKNEVFYLGLDCQYSGAYTSLTKDKGSGLSVRCLRYDIVPNEKKSSDNLIFKQEENVTSIENNIDKIYIDKKETRKWNEIDDFKNIYNLFIEAQQSYYDKNDNTIFKIFLNKLPSIEKYNDFDITYTWTAKAYAALGDKKEAEKILINGLKKCKRVSVILSELGNLHYEMKNQRAIVWWIQSCIAGNESYMPYLYLSYAAGFLNNNILSLRLLAAADIVASTTYRFNSDDELWKIKELTNKDTEGLMNAFKIFESEMDKYLPSPDFLPVNEDERSLFMNVDLFDPNKSKIIEAKIKLITR